MSVVSREEIRKIAAELKAKGKKIVLANGCFDLIHIGHIRYLREAKSYADVLIVAINSDESVRSLKGPGRPLLPERERAEIVDSLEMVDYVFIFDEPDVREILRELRPDYHAKGGDYTPETVPEKDVAEAVGAKVIITGGGKVRSTSEIIKRIKELYRD